ncbi:MAG: cysteine hydrolase [Nitratireductor sp.]|nr:cysteine hydrolase [Nitratireductor sp.]
MSNVDPKKRAIILIDMARDFVEEGGFIANAGGAEYREAARGIIAPLQKVLAAARKAGVTVIFSTDEHTPEDLELKKWPPHSMKGTKWAEIMPELGPEEGDLVLPKTTYSGFLSSDIEKQLKDRGIESVYMTGLHTDCCCRHTSGDLFQRGYDIVWITDALQAFTQEAHEAGLEYYKTYYATDNDRQFQTSDEVVADLSKAAIAA